MYTDNNLTESTDSVADHPLSNGSSSRSATTTLAADKRSKSAVSQKSNQTARARWSFLSKNFIGNSASSTPRKNSGVMPAFKGPAGRRHSIAVLAPKSSAATACESQTRPQSMDDLSVDCAVPHGSDIFMAVMRDFQDELRVSRGGEQTNKVRSENTTRRRVRWRDDV